MLVHTSTSEDSYNTDIAGSILLCAYYNDEYSWFNTTMWIL